MAPNKPISVAIVPLHSLLEIHSWCRLVKLDQSSSKALPTRELELNYRSNKEVKRRTSVGMDPESELDWNLNRSKFVKSPNSVGMVLLKLFESTTNSARPLNFPTWVGSGPPNRLL